jgi:Glyoxalase-like domain
VSIGESRDAALHLSFQRAPGYVPPTWPDPASSMQFLLHIRVRDVAEAEREVLALGGRRVHTRPDAPDARDFADPAGHPFASSTHNVVRN